MLLESSRDQSKDLVLVTAINCIERPEEVVSPLFLDSIRVRPNDERFHGLWNPKLDNLDVRTRFSFPGKRTTCGKRDHVAVFQPNLKAGCQRFPKVLRKLTHRSPGCDRVGDFSDLRNQGPVSFITFDVNRPRETH